MNSSLPPKVSVCIPVYNGSKYIAKAIESVLAQTYKDFSLIVVDNCSTDNTEEIVRNFHDPRLTYKRNKENIGLVGNANRCLELAKGEYIYILHHDDIMLPENLERKVSLLDKNPKVGFVHSNILVIDGNGDVVAKNIWYEGSRKDYIKNGKEIFYKSLFYLPYGASIFIGSVLARRKCYEHVGKFSPELPHCFDSEMWNRMSLFYDIACIGSSLVKYRVHEETASTKWGNYLSFPYAKEHFLAAMITFNKYDKLITDSQKLKKRVCLSFAERFITLAKTAIINGDYFTAKSFIKEAPRVCPQIQMNLRYWLIAVGVSSGPNGYRFYKFMKKVLGNKNTT